MTSTLRRASAAHAREPWMLYADGAVLTVRGALPRDLPAVALMHARCSAKTLLDRYRSGGRAPALAILEEQVREPLSFVLTTENGRVVALSQVVPDDGHPFGSGEVSLLVEDGWQRLAIGRRMLRHTAAAAALSGYRQLISYPGTTSGVVQRMVARIGATRVLPDPQRHLHTTLSESARRGLGAREFGLRPPAAPVTG